MMSANAQDGIGSTIKRGGYVMLLNGGVSQGCCKEEKMVVPPKYLFE